MKTYDSFPSFQGVRKIAGVTESYREFSYLISRGKSSKC